MTRPPVPASLAARRSRSGARPRSAVRAGIAVALALALGTAVPGIALGDAPPAPEAPQPPPRPPPPGAERVELHLRFEPWALSGRFRLVSSSGAVADEGLARDDAGFAAQRPVERVLEGARGTLVLSVSGGPKSSGVPPIFGRWRVVRGTGAYEAVSGAGTFTSCGRGDGVKGSPFEVQTLVGHLHPIEPGPR